MTDERIVGAIDGIEPEKDAEKRMYENILKKAELNGTKFKALRYIKPAVSTAACVCLVAAAAFLLRMEIKNTVSFTEEAHNNAENAGMEINASVNDAAVLTTALTGFIQNENEAQIEACEQAPEDCSLSLEANAGGEEGKFAEFADNLETEGEYVLEDTLITQPTAEKDFDMAFEEYTEDTVAESPSEPSFNAPENAQVLTYGVSNDASENALTGEFVYEGRHYSFAVWNLGEDSGASAQNDGTAAREEIRNYSDASAVLYAQQNGDKVIYEVRWENGKYAFSLKNSDGADKKEIIGVAAEAIEIN